MQSNYKPGSVHKKVRLSFIRMQRHRYIHYRPTLRCIVEQQTQADHF